MADDADISDKSIQLEINSALIAATSTPITKNGQDQLIVNGKICCVECGSIIPKERLNAVPTNLCIECAENFQSGKKDHDYEYDEDYGIWGE